MRVVQNYSLQMPAAVTTSVAASQAPAAGGVQSLTLAATASSISPAQHVTLSSDANDSGKSFVLTGTAWGQVVSETITGPNSGTVTSVNNYDSVTSLTISANSVGNITAGNSGTGESQPFPFNPHGLEGASIQVRLVSGSVNWTLQQTVENVLRLRADQVEWISSSDANAVGATTSIQTNYAFIPAACRVKVTSGTGKLLININQAGDGWS